MALTATPKLADLESLTDDDIRRAYDEIAPNTIIGLEWYREELSCRRYERDAKAMHQLTKQTVRLTSPQMPRNERLLRRAEEAIDG